MPLNDTGKPFLWRKPVTHIRALVGIIQIPQLPFHGNLFDIMKVLFIIQHPAGEHPLPVLVKGDDGFQFPDLVISRMGCGMEKDRVPEVFTASSSVGAPTRYSFCLGSYRSSPSHKIWYITSTPFDTGRLRKRPQKGKTDFPHHAVQYPPFYAPPELG